MIRTNVTVSHARTEGVVTTTLEATLVFVVLVSTALTATPRLMHVV